MAGVSSPRGALVVVAVLLALSACWAPVHANRGVHVLNAGAAGRHEIHDRVTTRPSSVAQNQLLCQHRDATASDAQLSWCAVDNPFLTVLQWPIAPLFALESYTCTQQGASPSEYDLCGLPTVTTTTQFAEYGATPSPRCRSCTPVCPTTDLRGMLAPQVPHRCVRP